MKRGWNVIQNSEDKRYRTNIEMASLKYKDTGCQSDVPWVGTHGMYRAGSDNIVEYDAIVMSDLRSVHN